MLILLTNRSKAEFSRLLEKVLLALWSILFCFVLFFFTPRSTSNKTIFSVRNHDRGTLTRIVIDNGKLANQIGILRPLKVKFAFDAVKLSISRPAYINQVLKNNTPHNLNGLTYLNASKALVPLRCLLRKWKC